ncbi:hypothetical protein, partial [Phenylobacterium sp.]|uniref:hypothetical protein n=1 Tax=Phenylobacterium sp. TaxID=1871053 RepID=UPI0025FAC739
MAAAALAVASPAFATTPIPAGEEVQYTFNGVFPPGLRTPASTATFVIDTPTFITAPETPTPDSCTGCGSLGTVVFFPNLSGMFDEITINGHNTLFSDSTGTGAVFDTIGTSTGFNNASTLTVAFVKLPGSAAPEPVTWSLLVGGFFSLGAALRRRRIVATPVVSKKVVHPGRGREAGDAGVGSGEVVSVGPWPDGL